MKIIVMEVPWDLEIMVLTKILAILNNINFLNLNLYLLISNNKIILILWNYKIW